MFLPPSGLIQIQRTFTRLPCRHVSSTLKKAASGDKPYYLTTPIFYPNAAPHIGHLYSLVVADIHARFKRLLDPKRPVLFLTGTDEHGLKIQRVAHAKGFLQPKEFCDQLSARFRKLAEHAHISHTCFMRTSSEEHHDAVKDVWRKLDSQGLIYKGNYSGWYSVTDECFYTDAQVSKVPENGSSNTISLETGSPVEWQEETNYMFRLSRFQPALLDHYKSATSGNIIFPPHHQSHIVDVLSQPLEDLSISRPRSRLSWGVPVPTDPDQTVYVWFDALLVYLSGLGYPWKAVADQFPVASTGWPVDLQVIGKDILRFHAIYFPAMLLALGLPLPRRVLAHAHWTVEQKKMSKSLGNVVDPFEAINEHGVDVVRYYLARVGGRFRDDVDWSQVQLNKYSKEIQSLLGNFLLRITSNRIKDAIAGTTRDLSLEDISRDATFSPNASVIEALRSLADDVGGRLEQMEVGDAIEQIVQLLRQANKAVTDVAPWKPNTPPEVAYASYLTSIETLRVAGICLQPFAPGVASRLLDVLKIPVGERNWESARTRQVGCAGMVEGVRLF